MVSEGAADGGDTVPFLDHNKREWNEREPLFDPEALKQSRQGIPETEWLFDKAPSAPRLSFSDPARWKLGKTIGAGPFGTVREVTDLTGELSDVVDKHIRTHFLSSKDPSGIIPASRLRDAELHVRGIKHPSIITIHGAYQRPDPNDPDDTEEHLVMERLHGETLREYLQRQKNTNESEAIDLIKRLADADAHVYRERGIIHRDLRPVNIMNVPKRGPVLFDFGIAAKPGEALGTAMTRIGDDERFLAPNARDGLHTLSDDGYAIAQIAAALRGNRPNGHELSTDDFNYANKALAELLARNASYDPSKRSANPLEFARELEAIVGGGAITVSRPTRVEPLTTSGKTYLADQYGELPTQDDDYTGEHPVPRRRQQVNLSKLPAHLQENPELLQPYSFTGRRVEDVVRALYANKLEFWGDIPRYQENIFTIAKIMPTVPSITNYGKGPDIPIDFLLEHMQAHKRELIAYARSLDSQLVEANITSQDPRILREHGVTYETQLEQILARKPELLEEKTAWKQEREQIYTAVGFHPRPPTIINQVVAALGLIGFSGSVPLGLGTTTLTAAIAGIKAVYDKSYEDKQLLENCIRTDREYERQNDPNARLHSGGGPMN